MTEEKGQAKEIVNVREMSDDEFVEKYGRLVHHCVWKRYAKKKASIERDTGLDIEDLTQFGMIGLIKARDNFDLEFGCAFSTYAVPKILGEIGRAIRDNQKIKVQRTVYGVKGKILNQQLADKEPEEIADILNEPVTLVKMALEYQPSTDSLNKVVYASGANEELTLETMIEDTKMEDIEETTINRAVIRGFKAALPPKEYIVLDMRLQNMTQQNIANQMGYSQVQISRILAKISQRAAQFGKEGGLQD